MQGKKRKENKTRTISEKNIKSEIKKIEEEKEIVFVFFYIRQCRATQKSHAHMGQISTGGMGLGFLKDPRGGSQPASASSPCWKIAQLWLARTPPRVGSSPADHLAEGQTEAKIYATLAGCQKN